jgi:ankyrin repeat protein
VLISITLELINAHDDNGTTLLINALYLWQESIVELLLELSADTNACVTDGLFKTPLHVAMEQNLPFSVTALLDHSAHTDTVNSVNHMPLQLAEVLGHHHVVCIINKHMHCNKAF